MKQIHPGAVTPGYTPPRQSLGFWQPESYGPLCVGDFNHAANREEPNPQSILVTAFRRGIKKRNLPLRLMKAIQSLRSPSPEKRPSARATQAVIELPASLKAR